MQGLEGLASDRRKMLRRQVTAFVDWNSQLSNAGQRREAKVERQIDRTAQYVTQRLADLLRDWDKAVDLFNVDMRLYYGWHRGLTPTESRRVVDEMLAKQELPLAVGNARFNWQEPFGDVLLDAFDHRLHRSRRVHLPNTLRAELNGIGDREKMVDTALVCDVLCRARTEPDAIRIVMAEDDDVVPAVFVGERWGKAQGGKTVIARTRQSDGWLSLDGLVWQM